MRVLRILGIVAAIAMVLAVIPDWGVRAAPAAQTNLLQNPGFESTFQQFAHYQTAIVADKWLPWWKEQVSGDDAWKNRMPEYKPAAPYKDRIHGGGNAQQYFTYHGTHMAGLY
jgi:hypothetical protein